jgi:hypothetical protein
LLLLAQTAIAMLGSWGAKSQLGRDRLRYPDLSSGVKRLKRTEMRFDVVGEQLWRVESAVQKKEWTRVQRITSPRPCMMGVQHLSSWQYFRATTCLRRACPDERAWSARLVRGRLEADETKRRTVLQSNWGCSHGGTYAESHYMYLPASARVASSLKLHPCSSSLSHQLFVHAGTATRPRHATRPISRPSDALALSTRPVSMSIIN